MEDGRCAPFVTRGANWIKVDHVTSTSCDVLVPCTTGGLITSELAASIPRTAIAGAANNVLADHGVAEVLRQRGVVYAPELVANASGAIHVVGREVLNWSALEVDKRARKIAETLDKIFTAARGQATTTDTPRHLAGATLQRSL